MCTRAIAAHLEYAHEEPVRPLETARNRSRARVTLAQLSHATKFRSHVWRRPSPRASPERAHVGAAERG